MIAIMIIISLFGYFIYYPLGSFNANSNWFFEKRFFDIFSWVVGIQITSLIFVLSVYLPKIQKEVNKFSIGIVDEVRSKLIKQNPITIIIYQMMNLVIITMFTGVNVFIFSYFVNYRIRFLFIIFIGLITLLTIFMAIILRVILIKYDNYVYDSISLLPTDEKNQNCYFTVIKRQLDNQLSSNDTFSLNRDLIQVATFIDKYTQFTYFDQKCVLSFLQVYDIKQYINFVLETYENNVLRYSYSVNTITNKSFNIPEDNIDKFQNYMFTNNSRVLQRFLIEIVKNHETIQSEAQNLLIDYYCWCLDSLCVHSNDYSFIFALDITQLYKDLSFARYFLISAMKITLSRESNNSARGLYRGYLLCNHSAYFYPQCLGVIV
jgi:hypothetical protein